MEIYLYSIEVYRNEYELVLDVKINYLLLHALSRTIILILS